MMSPHWRLMLGLMLALIPWRVSAEDTRHPLTQAMFYGDNLNLVNILDPTDSQLALMAQIAGASRQLVAAREKEHETALARVRGALVAEREALRTGRPLAPESRLVLERMREAQDRAEDKLLVELDGQIQRWRQLLTPQQASRVDWRPPPSIAPAEDRQDELQALRALVAHLDEVGREIERIRYLIPSDYVTTRIGRINALLRPYRRPGSREFDEAREFVLRLTDEARLVPEREWVSRAPEFPARFLHYLGELEDDKTRIARPQFDWWDLHRVLTDPQTPAMFSRMLPAGPPPAP
jgi:hypothetical protein